MDSVFEVLSKPSADRTDEDIGQSSQHTTYTHHTASYTLRRSVIYFSLSLSLFPHDRSFISHISLADPFKDRLSFE